MRESALIEKHKLHVCKPECVGPVGLSSHPQSYGIHHPWIALGATPLIPVKKLQNTISPI